MKVIQTSGKRKRAICRATLKAGEGKVTVNGMNIDRIEPEVLRLKILTPIHLAGDVAKKVDVNVLVNGGGVSSRADAAGVAIAKALAEHSEKLEKVFLSYDRKLMVSDARRREQRKPNCRGKARSKRQKSYR